MGNIFHSKEESDYIVDLNKYIGKGSYAKVYKATKKDSN